MISSYSEATKYLRKKALVDRVQRKDETLETKLCYKQKGFVTVNEELKQILPAKAVEIKESSKRYHKSGRIGSLRQIRYVFQKKKKN